MVCNRVKLPKSFLAVNLSESHTFHKKDDLHEQPAATISSLDSPEDGDVTSINTEITTEGTSSANGGVDGGKASA